MSRDDLLADLQGVRRARPAAPSVPPPVTAPPGARATPALDVSLTPLAWSLPRVGAAPLGVGLAVRLGPLHVVLGVR